MPCRWEETPEDQLSTWDRRLQSSGACFHQYPYWIDSQASWRLRTSYLMGILNNEPVAFVGLLRYGFLRLRIGLVREGPVWLRDLDDDSIDAMLQSLAAALRDRGFVAVSFTHQDARLLSRISQQAPSNRDSLFSFPVDERESLCVAQSDTDEATAATFAPVARRNIRRAVEAGFDIECPPVVEALNRAWPVWQKAHQQPYLHGRSRRNTAALLRRASEFDALRLYLASRGGVTIQAILVAIAGGRATYVLGGLDRDALGRDPSPSCLLHFRAMRECHGLGCAEYDLGSRSGPVHRFKLKFRPVERQRALPVNWVLEPAAYEICRRLLPRLS